MTKTIDCYCTIGNDGDVEPGADELLAQMDKVGVDMAIISPPDRCLAWSNEDGNELVLKTAKQHPDRFIPSVTVNPWRPDAKEIVTKNIDSGGKMLVFSPSTQGFLLSGDKLDAIIEELVNQNIKIPIYIHTGHYSFSAPSQLALLARRFKDTDFIMGHSGATDFGGDVVPVCSVCDNIYPESSYARPPGFVTKAESFGFERAIMGSGYPYNQLDFEWSQMRRLLPKERHEAVLGGNLIRLLGGIK